MAYMVTVLWTIIVNTNITIKYYIINANTLCDKCKHIIWLVYKTYDHSIHNVA